jgi:hypothetical protein
VAFAWLQFLSPGSCLGNEPLTVVVMYDCDCLVCVVSVVILVGFNLVMVCFLL